MGNIDTWLASSLPIRKGMLESHWLKAQNIYEAILLDYGDDDQVMTVIESTQERAIACYGEASRRIAERMAEFDTPGKRHPKASEISAVEFSGNYAEWPGWRAQFVAKVYETTLECHEKLELLSKSLSGEAAACVGPIINRDQQELDRAWAMLTKRYDNEYQVAIAHLNEMLNVQTSRSDPAKGLRRIVDTIRQQMRLLQRFQLIIAIILRKLDRETYKEWERMESRNKMPELEEVMTFLERRIAVLTNWRDAQTARKQGEDSCRHETCDRSSHNRDGDQRHHNRATAKPDRMSNNRAEKSSNQPKGDKKSKRDPCLACAGHSHRLWNCRKFRELPLEQKVANIQEWKICPNCLIDKHVSTDCQKFGCPHCDYAKHNSLICPKSAVKKINHHRAGKRKHPSTAQGSK